VFTLASAYGVWAFIYKLLPWIWRNYHQRWRAVLVCLAIGAILSTVTAVEPSESNYARRTFLWFSAVSLLTTIWLGVTGELSHGRVSRRELEKAKERRAEVAGIISEVLHLLGEADEEPLRKEYTEADLRQALARAREIHVDIDKVIAEIQSGTSTIALERLAFTSGPLLIFVQALVVVAGYSTWVFPYIPLNLGGGQIVPVTLYESRPQRSPAVLHCGMLDQTDSGFYVLPSGRNSGLFLPRETVSAIYFSDESAGIDRLVQ
jgi:mRNA-degrading endonuclease YafQ of YafQ-DinJ toxin-antitoxin module